MLERGYLCIENGPIFEAQWMGGTSRAGEVVFNTSHSGYEEMATDPSYLRQILVLTAPMQGNYGNDKKVWESRQIWIHGFVCLEMQSSSRDSGWLKTLTSHNIPVLSGLDTRKLVLYLRDHGTPWGAAVRADSEDEARELATKLINQEKRSDPDWVYFASRKTVEDRAGHNPKGPRVAILDLGSKENILREMQKRSREIRIFPSRTPAAEIKAWKPDGILLTNGPGDPADVQVAARTVRELLGWKFIFGICMGHQILGLALGGKTYKLKFGHRGSNHPTKDSILNQIYMTSQNHGYNVSPESLPKDVRVSHINLNDKTASGIICEAKKCMSVQFHPESHPGPHEAETLFDYFVRQML